MVHNVATMTLDTISACVITLVALLTSSPVMQRKEHILNVSALQRVYHSKVVASEKTVFKVKVRLEHTNKPYESYILG
jgi:hypothetical protein